MHVHVFLLWRIAQRINAHLCAGGIQYPQYDFLAPQRGQSVDTKIDGFVRRQFHLNPAVLRDPPLRDFHLGHDLDSGSQSPGQVNRRTIDFG